MEGDREGTAFQWYENGQLQSEMLNKNGNLEERHLALAGEWRNSGCR